MIELRPITSSDFVPPTHDTEGHELEQAKRNLAQLLLGPSHLDTKIPPLADLVAAFADLADGTRRKITVPVATEPREVSLVRSNEDVLVSLYETGAWPEVYVLDRGAPLASIIDAAACWIDALCRAERHRDSLSRGALGKLRTRLVAALGALAEDPALSLEPVDFTGGAELAPAEEIALAFGFAATCLPSLDPIGEGACRADVHATLFEGRIWAWARGRRVQLGRGPIFLVAQRMVSAMRALVDGWVADRPVNVRVRAGTLSLGVRLERGGAVALSIGSASASTRIGSATDDGPLTLAALDVPSAAGPVLKLATDLIRGLCNADRSQTRNLRVIQLRDEVRALRRKLRTRQKREGFVHQDPDRLRLSNPLRSEESSPSIRLAPTSRIGLRFAERWRAEVEGLDATSTFLCGDRIVIATSRRLLALHRDSGEALWMRRVPRAASMMVGTSLLRLAPDGTVDLWDVMEGETTARTRIAPRVGGMPVCLYAGGAQLAPIAVLAEGTSRLVAIDLRTGEPLWRYRARAGAFRLRRAGRILIVASGENAIVALDIATGEALWRFSHEARFSLAPVVCRDVVVAVSNEPGAETAMAVGIDLYSGKMLWQRNLDAAPLAAPVACDEFACIAIAESPRPILAAFHAQDGSLAWSAPDVGVGRNGATMTVDDMLVVNAPGGRLSALSKRTGEPRWSRMLAQGAVDDVPRRLEPILRGGALFVPASNVHVVRPADGSELCASFDCDLIPDVLRVDERGWLYVAEESGHLRGFAPAPQLTLVRGGES